MRTGHTVAWLNRRCGRGGLALAIVSVLAVLGASPVSAHPALLQTSPRAGYATKENVTTVSVTFDETVSTQPNGLQLADAHGRRLPTSTTLLVDGHHTLRATASRPLPDGQYEVSWQVTGDDGDVVAGTYRIAVGNAAAPGGGSTSVGQHQTLTTLLRWLLLAGWAACIGGLFGERFLRKVSAPIIRRSRWLLTSAVVAALSALGLGRLSAQSWQISTWPTPALLELGQAAALIVACGLIPRFRRPALIVLAAVPLLEAFRSHLRTAAGLAGVAVAAVHLLAMALWAGALVYVVVATRRLAAAERRRVVRAYSRAAVRLVGLTIATGVIASAILTPAARSLTQSGWGRTLLIKLALVLAVLVTAAWARLRLRRRRRRGIGRLPRIIRAESALLVIIVGLAAALISFPVPTDVALALAAPPPTGPETATGTLVGQISVGAEISAGQIVLRLTAPDVDEGDAGALAGQGFKATLTVGVSRGLQPIGLKSCGGGCYYGQQQWSSGITQLNVRVSSSQWAGGQATLAFAWPPRDQTAALTRLVRHMRSVRRIRFDENVTSDTSRPAPPSVPVSLSGAAFLASEPYSSGQAPIIVAGPPASSGTTLSFAYPTQGIFGQLTLNAQDQPLLEVLSTPAHLITRRFH